MESPAESRKISFQYRYVPYGQNFDEVEGPRENDSTDRHLLHSNEIVLDVGGTCIGFNGEKRAVVDHHFFRSDKAQFPSAAAAVLHKAKVIQDRFCNYQGSLWLVTHLKPDFDAYCSLYLTRWLLESPDDAANCRKAWENARLMLNESGWSGRQGEINWYNPDVSQLLLDVRWPILLAANAACVDSCRRIACHRERALHSILYAAHVRGRELMKDGAQALFTAARVAISKQGLNPMFDSVLEDEDQFVPELRLLDREAASYARDIHRAARRVVYLTRSVTEFENWYERLKKEPLFTNKGDINLEMFPRTEREQADGIFLRDPESLLFKEWAREDTENSSMGRGFLFTAVAYSDGRRGAVDENTTDYYFAIDPERAGRLHLHNIWARLQAEEVRALAKLGENEVLRKREEWSPKSEKKVTLEPRPGFEGYAALPTAGLYKWAFFDPWWDGGAYRCSIVPTPNWGTLIRGGSKSDLSDDGVARIVSEELESGLFIDKEVVQDYMPGEVKNSAADLPQKSPNSPHRVEGTAAENYRFCKVKITDHVRLLEGMVGEQIGITLWGLLHPEEGETLPIDFSAQHLILSGDWIGVWSFRGVSLAYKASAESRVIKAKNLFEQIIALTRGLQDLIAELNSATEAAKAATSIKLHNEEADRSRKSPYDKVLSRGEELMREVAQVQHDLSLPDNRVLSQFFQSSRLPFVLTTLRDVYLSAVDREQARATIESVGEVAELQSKLEWVEVFIVGVYMVELLSHMGHYFGFRDQYIGVWTILLAILVPLLLIMLLRPFRHRGLSLVRRTILVCMMIVPLVLYLTVGGIWATKQPEKGEGEQNTHTPARPELKASPDGNQPRIKTDGDNKSEPGLNKKEDQDEKKK